MSVVGTAIDFLNNFNIFSFAGEIGSYGPITFTVSERKQLVAKDFSITHKGRTAKHARLGTVDITEFLTRELREASIPVKLIGTRISIPQFINNVQSIVENGQHFPLVIGGRNFGTFSLTSAPIKYIHTTAKGKPVVVEADLNLEEYVPTINRVGPEVSGILGTIMAVGSAIARNNSAAIDTLEGGRLW